MLYIYIYTCVCVCSCICVSMLYTMQYLFIYIIYMKYISIGWRQYRATLRFTFQKLQYWGVWRGQLFSLYCSTLLWNLTLKYWVLSKVASSTIFWVFSMTRTIFRVFSMARPIGEHSTHYINGPNTGPLA